MNHSDIIKSGGGATAVGRLLGLPRERVAAWQRIKSIPAAYWVAVEKAGVSTVAELARTVPPAQPRGKKRALPTIQTEAA